MPSLAAESLFWIAAVACAVAQLAILRSVVTDPAGDGTRPPGSAADPGRSIGGSGRRRLREATWALLPGVVLAFVLIWTWHTVRAPQQALPPSNSPSLAAPATGA
jgi:hypothetical protein